MTSPRLGPTLITHGRNSLKADSRVALIDRDPVEGLAAWAAAAAGDPILC